MFTNSSQKPTTETITALKPRAQKLEQVTEVSQKIKVTLLTNSPNNVMN